MWRAKRSSFAVVLLVAAVATGGAEAGWQDRASAFDIGRLGKLQESRDKGLAQAEQGGAPGDVAEIRAVLDRRPSPVSGGSLLGTWRCRTIKLGGMTPYVIYSWFTCRISSRGDVLTFSKLTGSQHTDGNLYPDASGGFVYLGASSVTGEPRHSYSGDGASAGAGATPDDQIGLLIASGPDSARIEFPYPVQESTFDVLELKR